MLKDTWRIWDNDLKYGDLLFRRATGEAEEMESSKSLCEALKPIYRPGMKELDVGCGGGDYILCLRKRRDPKISYTGVGFVQGDILKLPFWDGAFDLVICNNVILHLPPPPTKAFSELIRVSKKHTVIRTMFGVRNYIIREVGIAEELPGLPENEADLIGPDGEPAMFNYFNLYSERYVRSVVARLSPESRVRIESDTRFQSFDNRKEGGVSGTVVINGQQTAGKVIVDSRFLFIAK